MKDQIKELLEQGYVFYSLSELNRDVVKANNVAPLKDIHNSFIKSGEMYCPISYANYSLYSDKNYKISKINNLAPDVDDNKKLLVIDGQHRLTVYLSIYYQSEIPIDFITRVFDYGYTDDIVKAIVYYNTSKNIWKEPDFAKSCKN